VRDRERRREEAVRMIRSRIKNLAERAAAAAAGGP
jgi:hypothetical protein